MHCGMRYLPIALIVSATAAAQSNPAVGSPCAGADPIDSAMKGNVVAKPDRKPRREGAIVVQDSHFHMMSVDQQEQDKNTDGPKKWVVATGIIDTTGFVDPKTANITQSSDIALSHAVCEAFVKVAFSPAVEKGQKVRAPYKERFIFEAGAATQHDLDNLANHGGDRSTWDHVDPRRDKSMEQVGIELAGLGLPLQDLERQLGTHGALVRTVGGGQRVVDVDDRHDARLDRDRIASERARIPAAIQLLMMRERDLRHMAELARPRNPLQEPIRVRDV